MKKNNTSIFRKIQLVVSLMLVLALALISCKPQVKLAENSVVESAKAIVATADVPVKSHSFSATLGLGYSKHREDFASDVIFANFRNVKMGKIKEGILYRGASPIDNQRGRAKYANDLIKVHGIVYDVDLSDNDKEIHKHASKKGFASEYFMSLYNAGKVDPLDMTTDHLKEENARLTVKALVDMSKNDGPYYIHCVEGKHRTGFVLIIIEGLAGATYKEMVDDFMKTFENYNGITEVTNKEKYDAIKDHYIDTMLKDIAGDVYKGQDLATMDWVSITKAYLMKHGMTDAELDAWYKKLTD